ncbi:MAG: efflux RND transporter periplasmic adaptor subunit [Verrucomicrobia bacterium]|nr:efflux RND transporter periplasmic adaptor subunit [Verrucomicrobiota bacterium]
MNHLSPPTRATLWRGAHLAGLLIVTVALMTGCGKKSENAVAGPPGGMPPQEVAVVTLAPQRAEIVTELPGRTAACRIAEVRPQVSGIILQRLFTEGAQVKLGEQLYQINPATYQTAYDSAKADLAKAAAAAHVAELLMDRRKKLAGSKVISQQDYDDSFAVMRQAEADIASRQAVLEEARINLEYTKVLSPISGFIGRSMITEGALVTSGQAGALATVQQLDPIYVDITQSSSQLLRLQREVASGHLKNSKVGEATTRLVFEDGTEYSEPGTLQFSEVGVDPGTDSVTLRAVFPNPRRELLPGMFVRAIVSEGVNEQAILVPQKGVTRNVRGEPTAFVVGEGSKIELRVLKTDRAIGDKWLVTDGLKAGDRLIVEGLQKIAPGAEVRPVEVAEETAK